MIAGNTPSICSQIVSEGLKVLSYWQFGLLTFQMCISIMVDIFLMLTTEERYIKKLVRYFRLIICKDIHLSKAEWNEYEGFTEMGRQISWQIIKYMFARYIVSDISQWQDTSQLVSSNYLSKISLSGKAQAPGNFIMTLYKIIAKEKILSMN